ncbi:unnamed protein product, partial [Larinioides sclopetarius]
KSVKQLIHATNSCVFCPLLQFTRKRQFSAIYAIGESDTAFP